MTRDKGQIEFLLLLGAMAGVVLFFTMSLAFTTLLQESQGPRAESGGQGSQAAQKGDLGAKAALVRPHAPQGDESQIKDLLERLERERAQLDERISQVSNEIDALPRLPDGDRQTMEAEIQRLENKLKSLDRQLEEKVQARTDQEEQSLRNQDAQAQAEIEQLESQRKAVEQEVDSLRLKMLTAGTTQFRNPLFVECRQNTYVLYSQSTTVSLSGLDEGRFHDEAAGHDVVVLLVRPDGLDSFEKAYSLVKSLPIALSYEPVATDQKLDYLRRGHE